MSENYIFDFKKEILEYCQSEVDIFRRGMIKLRDDFIQLKNIDLLTRADSALLQIVFFITSVRDAAEPLNLVTFPKI